MNVLATPLRLYADQHSMDATLPDLGALYELKRRYQFVLYCDEAHSFLSIGSTGGGCLELWNDTHPSHQLPSELIDIRTGSFSKAVGVVGGFVCATHRFEQKLESYFAHDDESDCLPTAAILQTLWILKRPLRIQKSLRRLQRISLFCHQELKASGVYVYGDPQIPILPVHAGGPGKASELSYVLRREGVAATPQSKPAVNIWQSRVRLGLSADMTDDEVDHLLRAVTRSCKAVNLVKGRRTLQKFTAMDIADSEPSTEELDAEQHTAISSLDDILEEQISSLRAHADSIDIGTDQSLPILNAGHEGIKQYGIGTGSSRLLMGTFVPHLEAETALRAYYHQPAALTYSAGREGLMSTVAALCRPVRQCKSHFFLVPSDVTDTVEDGFRISSPSSKTTRVNYRDLQHLAEKLKNIADLKGRTHVTLYCNINGTRGRQLDLVALVSRVQAMRASIDSLTLLIDDSLGLVSRSAGSAEIALDLQWVTKILKASILVFGAFKDTLDLNGSYLVGNEALIQELRWSSRMYVFSVSPPPFAMSMVAAAVKEKVVARTRRDQVMKAQGAVNSV